MEIQKALKQVMYEYELTGLFEYHQKNHGQLHAAYSGIHAGGRNSAILHYSENNQKIEDGDLYLIDAGYEYEGYASDVTRTYPANGRFTGIQAAVYQVVLDTLNRTTELDRKSVV